MASPWWSGDSTVSSSGGEVHADTPSRPRLDLRAHLDSASDGKATPKSTPPRQIALTPMVVGDVDYGGVHLVARPGLVFPVITTEDDELMVDLPALGIMVMAGDREQLARSLEAAIAGAWSEYMGASADKHDPQASRRRFRLMECFKPY